MHAHILMCKRYRYSENSSPIRHGVGDRQVEWVGFLTYLDLDLAGRPGRNNRQTLDGLEVRVALVSGSFASLPVPKASVKRIDSAMTASSYS